MSSLLVLPHSLCSTPLFIVSPRWFCFIQRASFLNNPVPVPYPLILPLLSLLSPLGGSILFNGPPSAVAPFLCAAGYPQDEESSDADFCIDVLNGLILPLTMSPMVSDVKDVPLVYPTQEPHDESDIDAEGL